MVLSKPLSEQAARVQRRPARAICITSGKGGVGKTTVAVNLALTLARQRKRVMLLDADLGLANVDVVLGLQPKGNIAHVLSGERTLADIILTGPRGIKVIPSSSGIQRMAQLSASEHAGIINAFSELDDPLDMLIVDSAAGISDSVVSFIRACQEVLVVVTDDPASFTDAYALIKLLNQDYGLNRFLVVANRVTSAQTGRELFVNLLKVSERFLNVSLNFLGAVPEDPLLHKALKVQQAVVEAFPDSPSANAYRGIVTQLERIAPEGIPTGGMQFFIERLVKARQTLGAHP
ncbi:MAG: MinD/ParA family protein [Gammaproteobacteria bacterium]